MRRYRGQWLLGLAALTGAAGILYAVPQTRTPHKETAQTVSYDAGFAKWLNAPRTVEMSQGVTFNQDDAFLKTDAAVVVLDGQQRALNAKSQSSVHLYDPQNDLTGNDGFIDFTRHLATLHGNIVMVMKPGQKEAQAPQSSIRRRFTDAATLTCDLITYDYRKKVGRVPGSLTVHQKDRVLTADSGEYDTKTQVVTLLGNVHGHNGDGTIRAPRVTMGIQEGAEFITIPVPLSGVFAVRNENDETDTPAPSDTPAPPKKSAPPPKP